MIRVTSSSSSEVATGSHGRDAANEAEHRSLRASPMGAATVARAVRAGRVQGGVE